jgi:hypothetical protein
VDDYTYYSIFLSFLIKILRSLLARERINIMRLIPIPVGIELQGEYITLLFPLVIRVSRPRVPILIEVKA